MMMSTNKDNCQLKELDKLTISENHSIGMVFGSMQATKSQTSYTFKQLVNEANKPVSIEKDKCRCLAVHSAGVKTQDAIIKHNEMQTLWADLDSKDLSLEEIKQLLDGLEISCYVTYSTSSSCRFKGGTIQGKRWRVVIPLLEPVDLKTWLDLQQAITALTNGDSSATRIQQILYLPNNPEVDPADVINGARQHYESFVKDEAPIDGFNPPKALQDEINRHHEKVNEAKKLAKVELEKRPIRIKGDDNIIEKINAAFNIKTILTKVGYDYNGKAYKSPNSTSGGYGLYVVENERWVSFHGCDNTMGLQTPSCLCGDVFDLIVHHQYNGNFNKALKELADKVDPEGQKQRQQEFMAERGSNVIQFPSGQLIEDVDPTTGEVKYKFPISSSADVSRLAVAPNFLIDGWLETDSHGILYAESQSFKSFITIHMAHCIATGKAFCGQDIIKSGPVVFVIGEGRGGYYRRLKATIDRHGETNDIYLIEAQPNISQNEQLQIVMNTVEELAPVLIMFDTFSALAIGSDENSNTDIAEVMARVRDTGRKVGASTIIVHHTGKDASRGSRGASAFSANADFIYKLVRQKDTLFTTLSADKMKDAEPPKSLTIELEVVDVGVPDHQGEALTSLAVCGYEVQDRSDTTKPAKEKSAAQIMRENILEAMLQLNIEYADDPSKVKQQGHSNYPVYKLPVEEIRSFILRVGAYVPAEGSKGVEVKFTRTDGNAFNKQLPYLVKQGNIAGSDGMYWTI
ncbi:AAA family ATPase [Emcibacteraceae bacterium]|nr:AAA family ATPase [Emcibacteraceae bacterium]